MTENLDKRVSDIEEKLRPASAPAVTGALAAEPKWMAGVCNSVADDVVAIGKEACGDLGLRGYASTLQQGGGEAELQRREAERSAPLPPVSQRPGPARSTQLDAQIRAADRAINSFEILEARVRARRGEA